MTSGGVAAPYRVILGTAGAVVSTLAVYSGNEPGPLLTRLQGTSLTAVVVLVALIAGGLWVLRTASASAWGWAAGIAAVLATANLAGLSLRRLDGLVALLVAGNLSWIAVHWLGIGWMVTCALAALIQALDRTDRQSTSDAAPVEEARPGPLIRLVAALRAAEPARRRKGLLLVMGMLVLSRVPYLLVYWPGIMAFDTLRSYSFVRGTRVWDTYEPVGHTMLIGVMQWSGTTLGWGDVGGVAIGAITAVVASSAAFTFMLGRLAVWGLRPGIWAGALAWLALLPVFGYFSVHLVKDVPFSIAMVVLLTCIGEIVFGRPNGVKKLWPWVTLSVAGILAVMLRNNGIHVIALTVPLLLFPLRHFWKRILVVSAVLAAAYALYVGPVYAMLKVQPGPQEEAYSAPLQQLGRITKLHWADLPTADQEFITDVFPGRPPGVLAEGYVPWLADPMKLSARNAWGDRSTIEFLAGWARIAAQYPGTAIEATLANTVGYWDPGAPSYDGIGRWSSNAAPNRELRLDIPGGEPPTRVAAMIESSGIMPTKTYRIGLHDDGYRAIPVVGLAMSPGPICWLWLISALLVTRCRHWTALAVFVPAGVLLLTFFAGPVSGGQRYSLTLFMTLPLAVAAAVLATRRGGDRPAPDRIAIDKDADRVRGDPVPQDHNGHRIRAARDGRPGADVEADEHALTPR